MTSPATRTSVGATRLRISGLALVALGGVAGLLCYRTTAIARHESMLLPTVPPMPENLTPVRS